MMYDHNVKYYLDSCNSGSDFLDAYKEIPPVYAGRVRLLRWGNTSSAGMTMSLELLNVDIEQNHPFKGLRASKATKTEGQRLFLYCGYPGGSDVNPNELVYLGETILLWWAEDCSEGMKLTLKLREGPDGIQNGLHPCADMVTGKRSGQVLNLVSWLIEEDDVPAVPVKERKRFSELTPTVQSHILNRDVRFQNWIKENLYDLVPDRVIFEDLKSIEEPERFASNFVKYYCGIGSRADFKNNSRAIELWGELIKSFNGRVWKK